MIGRIDPPLFAGDRAVVGEQAGKARPEAELGARDRDTAGARRDRTGLQEMSPALVERGCGRREWLRTRRMTDLLPQPNGALECLLVVGAACAPLQQRRAIRIGRRA
jgi:hypothetical protein